MPRLGKTQESSHQGRRGVLPVGRASGGAHAGEQEEQGCDRDVGKSHEVAIDLRITCTQFRRSFPASQVDLPRMVLADRLSVPKRNI